MVDSTQRDARRSSEGGRRLAIVALLGAVLSVLGMGIQAGRWLRARSATPLADGASRTGGSSDKISDGQPVSVKAPAHRSGEILFQLHCAKCHGPEGHGDPDAIERMRPPPRDLASRPWRFGVDAESVRRVTVDGISGTSMPAFRETLSGAELDAVALHTLQLATGESVAAQDLLPLDRTLASANFVRERRSRPAPELKIADAEGRTRSLADERGRVVLLNFWGMSCEHCLAGMSKLQALADRFEPRGLTVLNICADSEDAAEAQRLVDRISPRTKVWVDESGLANSRFEVQVMPTIWLIDPQGQLIASARGMQDWASPVIDEIIASYLQGSAEE